MKFTAFATLFVALLVSGHAVSVPEANVGENKNPASDVATPEAAAIETGGDSKRELRGAVEDVATPPEAIATKDENNDARKMKETSGQSCGLCCNDDYYC
jgi:hypothetical protein